MREITKPTVAICTVLVFIFGCYMATRYLADAVGGQLPGTTVIVLILLRIVIALEILLPTTLYLSVVVALGRLYKDSEMTALYACGVSVFRTMRPVFFVSLIIAAIVFSLTLYIRPWAYNQFFRLKAQAKANFDLTRMKSGTFYRIENGDSIIFAEKVDHKHNQAKRVFIQTGRGDNLQIIYARRADQHNDQLSGIPILVFREGYLYDFSRSGKEDRIMQFDRSAIPLEPKENIQREYEIKAASTGSLVLSESKAETAELQWRLSAPLATLLLALLGVPLSRSTPRQGKYAKVITAALIFAVYYNLSAMAKKWVEQGVLNPIPGIWWVQALLVVLLVILLWRSPMTPGWPIKKN
jgi:lipopolysaccharide export system permease protein